ncbi:hypothetical protein BTO02_19170 [Paraburkholderia sp. SOS3]|nr:hypothetical protein BTO02_19170 [Paraburkholderia sp. SOS3]
MIDGWHCLFLKLDKIDASVSGQSENDCASNSGSVTNVATSTRTQIMQVLAPTPQEPEPSIIFRKY